MYLDSYLVLVFLNRFYEGVICCHEDCARLFKRSAMIFTGLSDFFDFFCIGYDGIEPDFIVPFTIRHLLNTVERGQNVCHYLREQRLCHAIIM